MEGSLVIQGKDGSTNKGNWVSKMKTKVKSHRNYERYGWFPPELNSWPLGAKFLPSGKKEKEDVRQAAESQKGKDCALGGKKTTFQFWLCPYYNQITQTH